MFQKPLVVTVTKDIDLVEFSIRTNDYRVDVYEFTIAEFKLVLANIYVGIDNMCHIKLKVYPNKYEIFAVSKPDFSVMKAQFEAQI